MSDDVPSSRFSSLRRSWFDRLRKSRYFHPRDRQELTQLLRELETDNLIDPDTLATIEGALQVSELQVRDIMVPRAQMVVVEERMEFRDFLPIIIESGHSRFPVIDEERNEVVGILLAKDLLEYLVEKEQPVNIRNLLRPPAFVPESKRLNILLREFRANRIHMAIVVDEYGGIAGLVTIEDIIEQIVGEIADEHDIGEELYIKPYRDDRYTVKARMPIEEFNEYFHTEFKDEEFDTIGGLVLKAFGHMPARGETLRYAGFKFKVIRADRRRVHLLRVSKLAQSSDERVADAGRGQG